MERSGATGLLERAARRWWLVLLGLVAGLLVGVGLLADEVSERRASRALRSAA